MILLKPLFIPLIFYFLIVNLIAFILMGADKKKAKKNEYRIPEKTLFFFAFIGGFVGGILGMKHFRHKTKHKKFTTGFLLILILWIIAVALLLSRIYLLF